MVQTPNIDALAARGTLFRNAYTNCPICVPCRASLATGRYVHQIRYWDNGFPYDGAIPSWGHRVREQGVRVDSVGKLHFRSTEDDNGWSESVEPLNVVDGIGDLLGCMRDNPPVRKKGKALTEAGPGDSTYLQYDIRNGINGSKWVREHANDEQPWVLFLSFVCPHPPYISFQEQYDLYPNNEVPLMPQWRADEQPDHPAIAYFRQFFNMPEELNEDLLRRWTAAYYGACTHLDQQIGKVLTTLDECGLTDSTRVIYTSDHGESLGARGLSGKFTLYEESAGVPFIMAGPDVPVAKTVETPISLVDCFPTVLDAVGVDLLPEDADLPGQSLWEIANAPDQDRTVFSEYHAVGTRNATFMLRDRQYKYNMYVNDPAQLFDLQGDPDECHDLIDSPDHQAVAAQFDQTLREMLDPEAVDALAKADQNAKIEAFGGREAVISRGTFTNSPVPGEKPAFKVYS